MASIWERHFTRDSGSDKDTEIDLDTLLKGDPFADWLRGKNRVSYKIFNDVLSDLTKDTQYSVKIFAVGDGSYVDQSTIPEGWFGPHVRLLAVVTPSKNTKLKFFVVGPLNVTNPEGFLQVASWNGNAFHFFGVENINGGDPRGWTYQGSSYDAFTDGQSYDASYLGPFNGHVNGAAIMKEIHQPWYHWLSSANPNFITCISPKALEEVQNIPYLIGSDKSPLAGKYVDSADNLEPVIEEAVIDWYQSRVNYDFCDPADASHQTPRSQPCNVHRWMAHLLLTTTVNFAASNNSDATTYTVPNDHFYNAELLAEFSFKNKKKLLPDSTPQFKANMDLYEKAIQNLHVSLLQEVSDGIPAETPQFPYHKLCEGTLGGGKQTDSYNITCFVETLANSEGVPFVCLQTSLEDAQGVLAMQRKLQSNGKKYPQGLLSETAVQAILMLDFSNPVYSWRRGVLMQYLPQTTTLKQSAPGPLYDLEQQFVDAVRKSSHVTDASSPEYQFVQLYDNPPDDFQKIFLNYFSKITKRLKTPDGVYDYLMLAESRRRIYRPLPLDEFGAQLPYALNLAPKWNGVEMTPDGTITVIPQRGLDFFACWTGTLHGYDPHILPSEDSLARSIMPRPTASRCPVMMRESGNAAKRAGQAGRQIGVSRQTDESQAVNEPSPTWDNDIASLFSKPYWVDGDPSAVGSSWIEAMRYWSPPEPKELYLDLADRSSVQYNIVTIYQHLRSRSMPVTDDPSQYWPEEALETLRIWANQGFRESADEPIQLKTIIRPPVDPPLRLRKDILSLTADELRTYREKLDTVLQVGSSSSKWQELGLLHAEWCLHYQQATFFWHRAYLAYVESLIDFPIPYWNGFAADTSDISSPHAGLPSIFLEESYVNSAGKPRPNPLRYAYAYNGKNKSGCGPYVERYAVLTQGPNPQDPQWVEKVHLFRTYHDQIVEAFNQPKYSVPQDFEGVMGLPWANLPAFTDHQDPSKYPNEVKQMYFDGNFELAHDNYHGWVGPDMADNTYTAFDPIFLSYHANMDRILEMYLRKKPGQQLTSGFPLQPFISNGRDLAYSDPRVYVYATIGDLAKPSQALGYLYAPPASPDYIDIQTSLASIRNRMAPSGGSSVLLGKVQEAQQPITQPKPKVIFTDVSCTKESFQIDVFVGGAASLDPNPVKNPAFIGRMTRLGMGPGGGGAEGLRNLQRCRKAPVARILDAAPFEMMLCEARAVQQVVTHLGTREVVDESEWKKWPGFEGKVVWL